MKPFYWYAGGVVALFVLVLIATVVYTMFFVPRSPGNDSGLVTMVAIGGPAVAVWLIALGWVVAIFWRKFVSHDPTVSQWMFYSAIVLLLVVIKSPFDAYKNFFP
jgi:hypothetical protein